MKRKAVHPMCSFPKFQCNLGIMFMAAWLLPTPVFSQEKPAEPSARPTTHNDDLNRREWYRDEEGHLTRRYPRRFDLRPRFYQDGYGYRYGVPTFEQVREEEIQRAYQQGVEDGRAQQLREMQAQKGIGAYQHAMEAGQTAFEQRDYGLAARNFLLAATLNQGDPTSRLSAAHAQTALGEYASAARLIRRAFELEPRLVYLPMDIRGTYADETDFNKHVKALAEAVDQNSEDVSLRFLLGYYYYYSDNMGAAATEFKKAAAFDQADPLLAQLAQLARLSTPHTTARDSAHSTTDH